MENDKLHGNKTTSLDQVWSTMTLKRLLVLVNPQLGRFFVKSEAHPTHEIVKDAGSSDATDETSKFVSTSLILWAKTLQKPLRKFSEKTPILQLEKRDQPCSTEAFF